MALAKERAFNLTGILLTHLQVRKQGSGRWHHQPLMTLLVSGERSWKSVFKDGAFLHK